MKNAYTRFLPLVFYQQKDRFSEPVRLTAFCDRFVIDPDSHQTHLLSVVGSESVIASFCSLMTGGGSGTIRMPGDQPNQAVSLGKKAFFWKGSFSLPGRMKPVRHVVALSEDLQSNSEEGVLLLNGTSDIAWAMLANKLGLPALPEWAGFIMKRLKQEERIEKMLGHNCTPVRITATREELLSWISLGIQEGKIRFPPKNRPVVWPEWSLESFLRPKIARGERNGSGQRAGVSPEGAAPAPSITRRGVFDSLSEEKLHEHKRNYRSWNA